MPPTEHASTGLLAPLENPTFGSILLASQLSSLGWLMRNVALGWLMAPVSGSDVLLRWSRRKSHPPMAYISHKRQMLRA
ncbi:hypothetical protein CK222_30725 [Mesorhizobium sp. WSM3866]|nr:hypothetical protein CK222_30725 [Mesorhizobium sp. WSM3866]